MLIGVDLGGTRIKFGLVRPNGEVVTQHVAATGSGKDVDSVTAHIAELLRPHLAGVTGIGLAAAGVLDHAAGVIRESPNFPEWRDVALGRLLADALGLPVHLENDVNAMVLGEHRAGAGRGYQHVVGLALGTGVGGGIILNGGLWRGSRGMAAELGHVTVERQGRLCGCGNRGCLEQYAGAVGIQKSLAELGYADLVGQPDASRIAAERARNGDMALKQMFDEIGMYLGVALGTYLHTLDVQRFIIGGGLAYAADLFLDQAVETMRSRTFKSMSRDVSVVVSELGEDAGIIGAAFAGTSRN